MMDSTTAKEIIACLPQERTLFHYFKDRYAFYLLGRQCQKLERPLVSELKIGPTARFMQKPAVRNYLANNGERLLNATAIQNFWPLLSDLAVETYRLSLGLWGNPSKSSYRSQQTTRKGVNLVLHLNFNSGHDTEFENWTGISKAQSFNYWQHPVSRRCKNTLAWARMDIDLDSNSVLIEEIQTDWLRRVDNAAAYVRREKIHTDTVEVYGMEARSKGILSYQRQLMEVHRQLWSEAMLTACLWFIHEELGVENVYYHTVETGAALKNIRLTKPPVSMYRDLPRKFGFERCPEGPAFIYTDTRVRRRLRSLKNPAWNRLGI